MEIRKYYDEQTRFYLFEHGTFVVEEAQLPINTDAAIGQLLEAAEGPVDVEIFKQDDGKSIAVYNGLAAVIVPEPSREYAKLYKGKLFEDADKPYIREIANGTKTCNS